MTANRGRGRPLGAVDKDPAKRKRKHPPGTTVVAMRLAPDVMALIDAKRGSLSRGSWLSSFLHFALHERAKDGQ